LQELSLVHVTDLADALLAAAKSPQTLGRVYHAAHPAIVTQRALMAEIARAVGGRPRLVPLPGGAVRAALGVSAILARVAGHPRPLDPGKAPELLAPAWTCATDALERDAGWQAQMPLARGAREAADWYRQAGWL
jgi:nucleoside-diphosphate-sugar epimerase